MALPSPKPAKSKRPPTTDLEKRRAIEKHPRFKRFMANLTCPFTVELHWHVSPASAGFTPYIEIQQPSGDILYTDINADDWGDDDEIDPFAALFSFTDWYGCQDELHAILGSTQKTYDGNDDFIKGVALERPEAIKYAAELNRQRKAILSDPKFRQGLMTILMMKLTATKEEVLDAFEMVTVKDVFDR